MLQPDNNYIGSTNSYFKPYDDLKQTHPAFSHSKPFLAKIVRCPTEALINQDQVDSDTLAVEQNDVVLIEQVKDDNNFLAKSDQLVGYLSVKCCEILDEKVSVALCRYLVDNSYFDLHVCFASFVAQDVGDLSITKGDIIVANNQVNEHWLQGQVCYDCQANRWPHLVACQQVGSFPLNHCWLIDPERTKAFCHDKLNSYQEQQQQTFNQTKAVLTKPIFAQSIAHSSSLSSGTSSLHSADSQPIKPPPPRPEQLPKQSVQRPIEQPQKPSILSTKQQDKLKGWLHTVKKKTARLSTRITASLGLISLTRDEEFERHYDTFKNIEKTIRTFIKNLNTFVEHFENFLISLQHTSDNLSDFYRNKSHQRELEELRKKNKALNCEHFHAFKRTVERQVVAATNQLLQKFSGPHQLISKRSAKLLDFEAKTKEMESCRDLEKKASLRDQHVIAKDLYDRINAQLIAELPLFNQLALSLFRECILVLLESRRNLILSYTKQTASLLNTPLMMTYTASDVASSILMSCEIKEGCRIRQSIELNELLENNRKDSGQTSSQGTRHNSANDDETSRPHSAVSRLSSEFDQMVIAREISSTPLSQVSETRNGIEHTKFDEPDGINEARNNSADAIAKTSPELTNGILSHSADEGTQPNSPAKMETHMKEKKKKRKTQIYIASWPFMATGPNQLTIACKQPLKLIKGSDECGNSEWSLVQDKKGQLGYVPSSYIKKKD